MRDLSVCGIDCKECKFRLSKGCPGCRKCGGKVFWGDCDLFKCCIDRKLSDCGQCSEFPCGKLKEWAAAENPERIQNLIDLHNLN